MINQKELENDLTQILLFHKKEMETNNDILTLLSILLTTSAFEIGMCMHSMDSDNDIIFF